MSVRAELAGRHPESLPELLAEVVLRIEAAAAGDHGDAKIAGFEQASRFFQPLLFEEVAEQATGGAVESAGDVLPRVPELFGDRLDGDLLIGAKPAPNGLDQ